MVHSGLYLHVLTKFHIFLQNEMYKKKINSFFPEI